MEPYNKPGDIDSYLYEIYLQILVVKFYSILDHFKIWKSVNKIGKAPRKHQVLIDINHTEITDLQLCPLYGIPSTLGIFFIMGYKLLPKSKIIVWLWPADHIKCLCFLLASVISPLWLSGFLICFAVSIKHYTQDG